MQEADDTLYKLLRMQTQQVILCFLQIHLPKPNLCCIVQEQAAGGIFLHVNADKMEFWLKQKETSPH